MEFDSFESENITMTTIGSVDYGTKEEITNYESLPWLWGAENDTILATSGSCDNCAMQLNYIMIAKGILLALLVSFTIGGNVLILIAVIMSRNLRSSTHYLIVNLAVADLLLGTTVLPFSATLEVSNIWYFGQIFCEIWAAVDVLCCTASIWSLCVISLDRYIGVTRPLAYSTIMTEKRVCILIGAVWALSTVISIGPAFGWKTPPSPDPNTCSVNQELGYVLFSVVGSFYLPGFIIVAVYSRIYKAAIQQSKFLESGIKKTSSEITLRVHKGGGSSIGGGTNSRRNSSTKLPLRVHRGSNAGYQIDDESSLSENVPNGIHSPAHLHSDLLVRAHRGRASSMSTSKSHYQLSVTSSGEQWTHLHPEDALLGSPRRKYSADSNPSVSPDRRMPGLPGRLAKFKRQKKAAKTLGIVVGVFLLCWLPFFFVLPLASLCSSCRVPDTAFAAFFWLGYFNSCLNPFIYASTSREFKRAFQRILCHKTWWTRRKRSLTPSFSYTSSFRKSPKGFNGLIVNAMPITDPCTEVWKGSPKNSNQTSRSCSCECEINIK